MNLKGGAAGICLVNLKVYSVFGEHQMGVAAGGLFQAWRGEVAVGVFCCASWDLVGAVWCISFLTQCIASLYTDTGSPRGQTSMTSPGFEPGLFQVGHIDCVYLHRFDVFPLAVSEATNHTLQTTHSPQSNGKVCI